MKREELERLALKTVSPEFYYDLADNIGATTDAELRYIIRCNGDVEAEQMYDSYTSDLFAKGEHINVDDFDYSDEQMEG